MFRAAAHIGDLHAALVHGEGPSGQRHIVALGGQYLGDGIGSGLKGQGLGLAVFIGNKGISAAVLPGDGKAGSGQRLLAVFVLLDKSKPEGGGAVFCGINHRIVRQGAAVDLYAFLGDQHMVALLFGKIAVGGLDLSEHILAHRQSDLRRESIVPSGEYDIRAAAQNTELRAFKGIAADCADFLDAERLLCGDVGHGEYIEGQIALLCADKAVLVNFAVSVDLKGEHLADGLISGRRFGFLQRIAAAGKIGEHGIAGSASSLAVQQISVPVIEGEFRAGKTDAGSALLADGHALAVRNVLNGQRKALVIKPGVHSEFHIAQGDIAVGGGGLPQDIFTDGQLLDNRAAGGNLLDSTVGGVDIDALNEREVHKAFALTADAADSKGRAVKGLSRLIDLLEENAGGVILGDKAGLHSRAFRRVCVHDHRIGVGINGVARGALNLNNVICALPGDLYGRCAVLTGSYFSIEIGTGDREFCAGQFEIGVVDIDLFDGDKVP